MSRGPGGTGEAKPNGALAGAALRAAILAADDLPREPVEVPEWGLPEVCELYVRTMTGAEKDRYEWSEVTAKNGGKPEGARARLLVLCLVDRDGIRIFGEDDIAALGAKSSAALDRCYEVAARLNRLTAKDLDFLLQSWLAMQRAASSSASPSPSGEPELSS
ncbi:MAG TPA: hypothetical protein VGA50_04615 [Kiloniellales bacterium]